MLLDTQQAESSKTAMYR